MCSLLRSCFRQLLCTLATGGRFLGKPENLVWSETFLVSEFYIKAEDASYQGTGYANTEGGGWLVHTQKIEVSFIRTSVFVCLKLITVWAGYILSIMMVTILTEKLLIKEWFPSNTNLMNLFCRRCGS